MNNLLQNLFILIIICLFFSVLFFYFNYKKACKHIQNLKDENEKLQFQLFIITTKGLGLKILDISDISGEDENGSREKTSK